MIIKNNFYTIYFGNSKDNLSKHIDCVPQSGPLIQHPKFGAIIKDLNLATIAVLNQTHSSHGIVVDQEIPAFTGDGDYLITARTTIGLGVLTADCVPAILYDKKNHAIAAIHAGWRGAVAEIVPKAFAHMQCVYGSTADELQLIIGPSAKSCCYQVQEDFCNTINSKFTNKVLFKKDQSWYFDTAGLIALQMKDAGVAPRSIITQYNLCTMCDQRFFSHRRQAGAAGRQITIAALK
jgi:polyphenol oxidase